MKSCHLVQSAGTGSEQSWSCAPLSDPAQKTQRRRGRGTQPKETPTREPAPGPPYMHSEGHRLRGDALTRVRTAFAESQRESDRLLPVPFAESPTMIRNDSQKYLQMNIDMMRSDMRYLVEKQSMATPRPRECIIMPTCLRTHPFVIK